jgi:hypothetical protein
MAECNPNAVAIYCAPAENRRVEQSSRNPIWRLAFILGKRQRTGIFALQGKSFEPSKDLTSGFSQQQKEQQQALL